MLSLSTGIVLSVSAGLGVGSWQVLETGVVAVTGGDLGHVIVAESVVAVLLAALLFRQRPGPGTIVTAVLVGPLVGLLIDFVPAPASTGASLLMLAVGLVLLALGLGLYVSSDVGASPQDLLFVGLYRRGGLRPGVARLALDAILVSAGWALGGQVGAGTIVLTFGMPPLVEFSLRLGERLCGHPLRAAARPGAKPEVQTGSTGS